MHYSIIQASTSCNWHGECLACSDTRPGPTLHKHLNNKGQQLSRMVTVWILILLLPAHENKKLVWGNRLLRCYNLLPSNQPRETVTSLVLTHYSIITVMNWCLLYTCNNCVFLSVLRYVTVCPYWYDRFRLLLDWLVYGTLVSSC